MPIYSSFISSDGVFVLQIEPMSHEREAVLSFCLFFVAFAASTQSTGKAEQTLVDGMTPGRNRISWSEWEGFLSSILFIYKI